MSLVTKVLLSWKILLLGFILLFSVSIINSQFPIVPVSSLTFIVSTILVWFTSVCITFICLHKLLQRNEPIEVVLCPKSIKKTKGQVKPDPDNIKALCEDIDKYFIEKWYQYITKDESFSNESKVLLLEVINRLLEVQLSVDNKALLHGILNIYLRHLKEFRRSLRRQQKYNGSIEELYRYSHVCSTNNRSKDYFLHQLANNVLHHFINSELWNSLPCQVLVSILARKLLAYILKVASNPEVLNYIILRSIASRDIKEKYDLDNYVRIQIINVDKGRNEPGEDTKGVDSNRETHDNVDGEVTVTSASGDEVLTEKGEKIESECIREHKGAVPKISLGIRRRRRMAIKKVTTLNL
ncbi:unnamed protein product [Callosobruchus maculatus]|uniref:PXA domain-containing protein n=1 Tax=Callosobruchus maculatus TaxID=64391 RepID=A0A653CFT9_CALMS|nr:unnamed protein product [Callosobruchus maculatus]